MSVATVALLAVPPESIVGDGILAAPLRWLDDDAIIHRAIGAKRTHPPAPHFWPRLAVLAQVCLAVARAGQDGADGSAVRTGERLAAHLAGQLPPPGLIPVDPRVMGRSWRALRRAGLPIANLVDCANDLSVTLADPYEPHLEDLADLVDDTRIVLDHYRYAARSLRCGRNHRRAPANWDGRGPPPLRHSQ